MIFLNLWCRSRWLILSFNLLFELGLFVSLLFYLIFKAFIWIRFISKLSFILLFLQNARENLDFQEEFSDLWQNQDLELSIHCVFVVIRCSPLSYAASSWLWSTWRLLSSTPNSAIWDSALALAEVLLEASVSKMDCCWLKSRSS